MNLFKVFLKNIHLIPRDQIVHDIIYNINSAVVISVVVESSRCSSKTLQKGSCPYAPLDEALRYFCTVLHVHYSPIARHCILHYFLYLYGTVLITGSTPTDRPVLSFLLEGLPISLTLLYQGSFLHSYTKMELKIDGIDQRNIKSWDQQNDLVIRGFCYI